MNTLRTDHAEARAQDVRVTSDTLTVDLADGRTVSVPVAWFPRLLSASAEERKRVELSRTGLHWEMLDEDISITGLLAGRGDMTRKVEAAT